MVNETSVTYRDEKAIFISVIVLCGVCLVMLWAIAFTQFNGPGWPMWIIAAAISVPGVGLITFFTVELATHKAIVSDRSLIRSSLKGKREILKEDILLIADISIGKGDRHYVVYPQSFGRAEVEKHFSVYLSMGERTAFIQRDKRLLVFLKTKRLTELLTTFGYDSKITVIDY